MNIDTQKTVFNIQSATAFFLFIFISYLGLLSFLDVGIDVLENFWWLFFQNSFYFYP